MMHQFSASVESAFGRTKALLWPFNARVWIVLFLLQLISGGMGGCSGVKYPMSNSSQTSVDKPANPIAALRAGKTKVSAFLRENLKNVVYVGAILFILTLILLGLSVWFAARCKMVLIRCLLTATMGVRDAWRDTRALGESLFRFNLLAMLFSLAPFVIIAGFFGEALLRHGLSGIGAVMKANWVMLVLVGLAAVLFILGMMIALMLINRFLPVYMAITGRGPLAAFQQWRAAGRENWKNVMSMLIMYSLVSLGVGIAVGIAVAIVSLVLAMIFGGGALAGMALIKFLSVPKMAVIAVGVVLALPFFVALMILAVVPGETFKNYLAIELMGAITSPPS